MLPNDLLRKARALLLAMEEGAPRPAGLDQVCSRARHRLRTVCLPVGAAVWIIEGAKRIHRGAEELAIAAGELVLFPAQIGVTVENIPDTATSRYRALVLPFETELLARVAAHLPAPGLPAPGLDSWLATPDAPLAAVLGHLLDMARLCPADERVLTLCREQALTLLGRRAGLFPLLMSASSSWRARCAALIGADPGRDWSGPEVAGRLGVSERNLRRNLRQEDAGLRELLRDVRLNAALGMLQSGRFGVGEAASRCGYGSPSRFTARFRERFGLTPRELLRHTHGQLAETG